MNIYFGKLAKRTIDYSTPFDENLNTSVRVATARTVFNPLQGGSKPLRGTIDPTGMKTAVRVGAPQKTMNGAAMHVGRDGRELTRVEVHGDTEMNIFARSSKEGPAPSVTVLIDSKEGHWDFEAPADQLHNAEALDQIPAETRSEANDALALHQEMIRHFDQQA
jgi:hypothetical protein